MDADLAGLLARALGDDASSDAGASATEEKILDAAMAEVAAHGTRAATIDAIAARAGVGRITVFRRFDAKDALMQRLVLRELRRFLVGVDAAVAAHDDPAERLAECFVQCWRAGAEHPLGARVARREPGVTLEQLRRGAPSPLDLARAYVSAQVRDASGATDVLVRVALTYVLVPTGAVTLPDDAAARDFARRALVPLALPN